MRFEDLPEERQTVHATICVKQNYFAVKELAEMSGERFSLVTGRDLFYGEFPKLLPQIKSAADIRLLSLATSYAAKRILNTCKDSKQRQGVFKRMLELEYEVANDIVVESVAIFIEKGLCTFEQVVDFYGSHKFAFPRVFYGGKAHDFAAGRANIGVISRYISVAPGLNDQEKRLEFVTSMETLSLLSQGVSFTALISCAPELQNSLRSSGVAAYLRHNEQAVVDINKGQAQKVMDSINGRKVPQQQALRATYSW